MLNIMNRNKLKKPLILLLVVFILYLLFRSDKVVFTEKEYKDYVEKFRQYGMVPDFTESGKEIEIAYKIEDETVVLSLEEYKHFKYDQYKDAVSNQHQKHYVNEKPKLRKFPKDMERPSPYMLIRETQHLIDENSIQKELERLYMDHKNNGDDDIRNIPEVKQLLQNSNLKIPNIVHFIWFGCRRIKVHQYMSFLSALKYQNPDLILFHTNCQPNGTYWESFKSSAGSRLKIVKKSPPTNIWGNKVEKVEHQSDVARLQILLRVGGIYLDDDVITVRSLNELRHNEMVLGEENYDAVANSVIMANRDSWFLKRWFQEYQTFNDSIWSESSCFVPWSLWQLFPGDIHVVVENMLRPNWEEIAILYRELFDWTENFTIHLFSRFMYQVDGHAERSMMDLAILNTTYGEISRHVIWNDHRILPMQDWMLHYLL